ncbi:MAG: type VI secretion system lipoprotein TssJ [Acetobacteraceae bacterium]
MLGAAACSPPPPPPTVVNLTLQTSVDVNPNGSGQGAPVALRVYQLASPAGFEKAEFFRLLNADAATLGPDLVKRDEFLLAPGTTKSINLTPLPTVKAVGVFAAYRDFRNVTWRGTAEVPANKTTAVSVKADAKGVTVAAAGAK